MDKMQFDTSGCDKLMIVAHPDDETFWGGYELLKKGYFVVCITNGYNKKRKADFLKVLEQSENKGVILNFKDTLCINKFKRQEQEIKTVLREIISANNWLKVITHNQKGEYGHKHHKLISNYVSELYGGNTQYFDYKSRFYFWFRKTNIPKELKQEKLKLISIYKKSQFLATLFFRYSINI